MSFLFYPDIDPYPTTYVSHTYPEKGHHLHHVPLPYMAHKAHKVFHDKDQDVHQPKSDVRETLKNFYIEVELAGIKDKAELHLRWTSMRTLLISSKILRPEIPEEEFTEVPTSPTKPAAAAAADVAIEKKEENGATHEEEPKTEVASEPPKTPVSSKSKTSSTHSAAKKEPHLTVHERHIGELLRAFNFPVDVDRDNTHAKLDAGLLRIIVPKVEHELTDHVHVPVRIHDDGLLL